MARHVRILDDIVVNQIAAGEVVERPASVVKELVENAIDAGATDITVVLANGGRSVIEVLDNGSGMAREDALLAVERFGTSKIRTADDLQSVASLGFRGEAIPSIASVSRFTLQTQAREEGAKGIRIEISGGKLRDVQECEAQPGTRVGVRNLFFNVPARRKFLRSPATETGLVKSLLGDFAAAYPQIRFALVSDGQETAAFRTTGAFGDRVRQLGLVGRNALNIDASSEADGMAVTVSGVVSPPVEAVSGSAKLRLIVNGRSVRDRLLLGAIREGYGSFLKSGRYPAGVIKIELPAEAVDVNVHPQKSEVRFRQPAQVFAAVAGAVRQAIGTTRPNESVFREPSTVGSYSIGSSSPAAATAFDFNRGARPVPIWISGESDSGPQEDEAPTRISPDLQAFDPGHLSNTLPIPAEFPRQEQAAPEPVFEERPSSQERSLAEMRFVGQILHLYLLFESNDGMAIVDMHAAHERVMFYRLKQQASSGSVALQALLLPETINIPADKLTAVIEALPLLNDLGFDCEMFGDDALIVRATPALLGQISPKTVLDDLLSLPDWATWAGDLERRRDAVISRMACHRSVRSGRDLEAQEAYALLEQLEEAESSAFCPHGRPVVIHLTRAELESMFGRTDF